jgi:hypothetical protein
LSKRCLPALDSPLAALYPHYPPERARKFP